MNTKLTLSINDAVIKAAKLYAKEKNLSLSFLIENCDEIEDFENNYKQKLRTDWISFLSEMNIDNYIVNKPDKILVSTMHKAKGREFDNVFLLLNNYYLINDEKKRAVYVAITRAKNNLFIYTNQNYFDKYNAINLTKKTDNSEYENPDKISLYLTHRDINLGFFKSYKVKKTVSTLLSGQELKLLDNNSGLKTIDDRHILDFSKRFKDIFEKWQESGYVFEKAIINYIVWWYSKEDDKEFRVVLPEIMLKRDDSKKENNSVINT